MNSIQSYLSSSLFSQIKTRDINLNSKSYLSILRDDRLAFGMGTKFRKFYGIHKTFESKNIRSVFLQGELHSNALAAFCFLFHNFGYQVRSIAYARNPKRVTANSIFVKWNSHELEIFSSREEWKERIQILSEFLPNLQDTFSKTDEVKSEKNQIDSILKHDWRNPLSKEQINKDLFLKEFLNDQRMKIEISKTGASSKKDIPLNNQKVIEEDIMFTSVLIPEYGMCLEAAAGLDFVWKQIPIFEYDRLVVDLGSGLTFLSAKKYFGNSIPIYGISTGLPKKKMLNWLEQKRDLLGFSEVGIEVEKILEIFNLGGYGYKNSIILEYCNFFYKKYKIPVEPIYSGRSLYTIQSLIQSGRWKGRTLYLHQGGLWNFLDNFMDT
ncbi:1-aminocyclopropane-1-carboxylate deaminase [Leptospira noguchii]|uniref:1-aminocyclopropane-1-carboxylate deaminase n=1 Tax=Leptospira noguchii TaxID=28182 RepID=UPI001FB581FC|nr:1-aminocyclopropane-1-carboxylate deaminase [Leptospira noguchii]UOG40279.1 1-aminocyclopropane-1-carboxylate deaminase [Leptospira noguchii]